MIPAPSCCPICCPICCLIFGYRTALCGQIQHINLSNSLLSNSCKIGQHFKRKFNGLMLSDRQHSLIGRGCCLLIRQHPTFRKRKEPGGQNHRPGPGNKQPFAPDSQWRGAAT